MKTLIAAVAVIAIGIFVWRRLRDPYYLARAGKVTPMQMRLSKDASLANATGTSGETLLMHGAKYGHIAVVEMLLSAGADPNIACEGGGTALLFVSHFGYTDIARRLIQGGAKVSAVDADGVSALHYAAAAGHEDVVAVLLEAGADGALKTKAGTTALDDARRMGHQKIIARLEKTPSQSPEPTTPSGRGSS